MTQDDVNALTLGNIISWLLQPARTPDELVQVSALVKMRFEDKSFAGQTQTTFIDVSHAADVAVRAKFGQAT
jgi:hypothetical protein